MVLVFLKDKEENKSNEKASNRVISPHITIYRFPFPAWISILTRATGGMLYFGLAGLSASALICDVPSMIECIRDTTILLGLTKFTISFPFVFHTISGLRHLYWDKTAKGIELDQVAQSGYVVVASSAIITAGLLFLSF